MGKIMKRKQPTKPGKWLQKIRLAIADAGEAAPFGDLIGETELKNKKSDATWFVYLMRCADNSLYTGITNDLSRRLGQHNAGTASRYTRSRLPVDLVYHEPQESQSHALKRELAVKALSRQDKESLIKSTEQPPRTLNDP